MKNYIEVIKKYAVFSGRATRKEYWLFVLVYVLVGFVLGFVLGIAGLDEVATPVSLLYTLALLLPSLAVSVRRLHDTGRSGWWLLIGLIPFIGAIVLLVFYVLDSQPGTNKYGPNPKGVAGPDVVVPPVAV